MKGKLARVGAEGSYLYLVALGSCAGARPLSHYIAVPVLKIIFALASQVATLKNGGTDNPGNEPQLAQTIKAIIGNTTGICHGSSTIVRERVIAQR